VASSDSRAVLIIASRGKKFLRRFDADDGDDEDNLSDLEIRRRAGVSPSRRLTRSTLKPRILFPTDEQIRAREAAAAEEADEEAVTDIEAPCPTAVKADASAPSAGNRKRSSAGPAAGFRTPSPPPTAPDGTLTAGAEEPAKPTNKYLEKPKSGRSVSPFDRWSRVKPVESVGGAKGATAKRRGSPLEKSEKRVRSSGHGSI
jgi:hypothetical protein